jgi:hypothetical protein
MPTEILEPGGCDKTTSGWSACGSCSAAAETCDCVATSDCSSGSNEKSGARYHTFDTPVYQSSYSALALKVDYKVFAYDGDDSSACNKNQMVIQYSTNGGSSWSTVTTVNAGASNKTGTASQTISSPTTVNIANVQVRIYASATCCTPCASGDVGCGFYDEGLGRWFCWNVDNCGECAQTCDPGGC